jgi:DNA-binding NarL/FixJ family response regulator
LSLLTSFLKMTEEIKVIIADDHQIFIDGVKSLLRKEKNIVFVHESPNGNDAFDYISKNKADLLITDISMPGLNGTELTKKIKKVFPEVKVLVLTMFNDAAIINEIVQSEAEGYILKNMGKEELLKAITVIMDNGTYYSNEVISSMLLHSKKRNRTAVEEKEELTPRELEILKLISEEFSTAGIAEKLSISPRTVETHRKNILEKTQSKTIVGLIKYAFENNLISFEEGERD